MFLVLVKGPALQCKPGRIFCVISDSCLVLKGGDGARGGMGGFSLMLASIP